MAGAEFGRFVPWVVQAVPANVNSLGTVKRLEDQLVYRLVTFALGKWASLLKQISADSCQPAMTVAESDQAERSQDRFVYTDAGLPDDFVTVGRHRLRWARHSDLAACGTRRSPAFISEMRHPWRG